MQSTHFTIVIPTRERCDTLRHTLRSTLAHDYENFEIIVSDNASEDDTRDYVTSLCDSRVRYVNTGKRVSMSENWEHALAYVTSGWVTILGDDDALLPGALRYVDDLIKETGTQAIRSNGCSYLWPDLLNEAYGQLYMSARRGYRRVQSRSALQSVIDGRRPYSELPMLYNGGFVDFALLEQAKATSGRFYASMTPDVYSAIVLSLLIDDYVYVNEPLAINGASSHSGGTATFETSKKARSYDPAKKFLMEPNLPFHSSLPLGKNDMPVRCLSVLVYEAFLQAEVFHLGAQVSTSHQRQLELALIESGPDHEEVLSWGEEFALQHSLDFVKALQKSKSHKSNIRKRVASYVKILYRELGTYFIAGDVRSPLLDVSEAAVVGGSLKVTRPSRWRNIWRPTAAKVWRRLWS